MSDVKLGVIRLWWCWCGKLFHTKGTLEITADRMTPMICQNESFSFWLALISSLTVLVLFQIQSYLTKVQDSAREQADVINVVEYLYLLQSGKHKRRNR